MRKGRDGGEKKKGKKRGGEKKRLMIMLVHPTLNLAVTQIK